MLLGPECTPHFLFSHFTADLNRLSVGQNGRLENTDSSHPQLRPLQQLFDGENNTSIPQHEAI
jgi:hypothetical protein